MKTKFKTPEEKIKKALKDLKEAYREKIELDIEIEELESREISEIGAILDYRLEPSQLKLMEDSGLEFIKRGAVKFYNELLFEGYYDLLFCTVKKKTKKEE